MIFDHLEHAEHYGLVHRLVNEGWEFLRRKDLATIDAGRYELGGGAYASVQDYVTNPIESCVFESHRLFVDVQYLASGEEWIYVSTPAGLTTTQRYRAEEDCELYEGEASTRALMKPGQFLLLYPHDAHMPTVSVTTPTQVRKIVIKLPV